MIIASFNVNGIRPRIKCIEQFLKQSKADVLCIQEVRALKEDLKDNIDIYIPGYRTHFNCGTVAGKAGTAIMYRYDEKNDCPAFPISNVTRPQLGILDNEGRIIEMTVGSTTIVCVYSPRAKAFPDIERANFDLALANHLNSLDGNIIVCGDFNVRHTALDRPHSSSQNIPDIFEKTLIEGFERILESGFHDAWRELHKDEIGLTWFQSSNDDRLTTKSQGVRLDYILTTNMANVISCEIYHQIEGSDHVPVVLKTKGNPRGFYCSEEY